MSKKELHLHVSALPYLVDGKINTEKQYLKEQCFYTKKKKTKTNYVLKKKCQLKDDNPLRYEENTITDSWISQLESMVQYQEKKIVIYYLSNL